MNLTPDQVNQIELLLSRIEALGEHARALRDSLTGEQRPNSKDPRTAHAIACGQQTIKGQTCGTPACHNPAVHIGEDGSLYCADCYRDQKLAWERGRSWDRDGRVLPGT